MAEPDNHTLHLLRKMDRDLQEIREKIDHNYQSLSSKIDRNYQIHQRRLNGLQLGMQGKSFEDHCAVARLDQRTSALEKRAARPRKPK
jgi:hypothetical protein